MGFLETLGRDLRHAVRMWRKSPGFTVVAVLTLALGIGANTAVFSLVHAVMLRSLPYPDPSQLVELAQNDTMGAVNIPEYQFWTEHSSVFSSTAGYQGVADQALISADKLEWVKTMRVTAGLFRTLGVNPALGRDFNADETRPGGPLAMVLTDGLWRRSFGANPEVVGRTVRLEDASYTVVAVLPSGFWFPDATDAFVPLRPSGSVGDKGVNTRMIGRLKPDVSLRQATSEMAIQSESFRRAFRPRRKTATSTAWW